MRLCTTNLNQKKNPQEAGFTLIELLIVIGIMAILMSLAMPAYQQYIRKAHYAEIIEAAAPLKLAVALCFQETGALHGCRSGQHNIPHLGEHGVLQRGEVKRLGVVHMIPREAFGLHASDDLILSPTRSGEQLIWQIKGGAVAKGYVHASD